MPVLLHRFVPLQPAISGREHGVDIVNGSTDALVQNNDIRGFDRSAMVFDDHSWDCAGCGSNPTRIRVIANTMIDNIGSVLLAVEYCCGSQYGSQSGRRAKTRERLDGNFKQQRCGP